MIVNDCKDYKMIVRWL